MKTLEPSHIEQLLDILQKKPAQRLVHFSDSPNSLTPHLHRFCQKHNNEYFLYCTQDDYFNNMNPQFDENDPHIHITKFNLHRPRYLLRTIEFNYLISTLDFKQQSKSEFLKKCYPIIRTGGSIIIIIPNSGYPEKDEWRDLLEKQYYVSVSIIENIFDNYDVIVATRMHGWGD